MWSRATLHRAMQYIGFSFSRGPNHYDMAREKPFVRNQRSNCIDTVLKYRQAGRTIYHTDERWLTKNMTSDRTWKDGTSDASLKVPSGKGGRIIVAHVASRKTRIVVCAAWVFVGKKNSGDYHAEMNSTSWLIWLEDSVLPKIRSGVLVIDRAPYHLVRNEAIRPAASRFRKDQVSDWLEAKNLVLAERGPQWRTTCTRAVLKKRADENRPIPHYLVQDLTARFDMSVLISPVAHPELNPIEMGWGTVKMALKRANTSFSLATLRHTAEVEFVKITAKVWDKYEDHPIKQATYYRADDEVCAEVEAAFNGDKDDDEVEGSMDGDSEDESGSEDGGQEGETGGSMSEYVCCKSMHAPGFRFSMRFHAVQLRGWRHGRLGGPDRRKRLMHRQDQADLVVIHK